MLELEIKRPGSLLSVVLKREITEEQAAAIGNLLGKDRDVIAIELPQLTGAECGDIAITAAEGGIRYWSVIDRYHPIRDDSEGWVDPVTNENIDVPDEYVFYTIEYINPNSDSPPRLKAKITPVTIRRGFKIMSETPLDKGGWPVPKLLGTDREDWTGEIDSEIADMLIQFGVFGSVVFG